MTDNQAINDPDDIAALEDVQDYFAAKAEYERGETLTDADIDWGNE